MTLRFVFLYLKIANRECYTCHRTAILCEIHGLPQKWYILGKNVIKIIIELLVRLYFSTNDP